MSDQLSADLKSLRIDRNADPDRPSRGGRVIQLAIAVAVIVGLFVAWRLLGAKLQKPEVAVTEIRMISPAQAQITVTSTGYVIPQVSSKVGPRVDGRIFELKVKEGDRVKAGDLLVKLEDAEIRSRLAAARARAAAARAEVDEQERKLVRQRALDSAGATARATLEDLEARIAVLAATAKANDAEVGALAVMLSNTVITAPMDGVVIGKPRGVGEQVGPFSGPILELADFASLQVETDVPESRLSSIRIDGPAEISLDAFPGKRFRGRVVELSPRVNRAKATVVVKVKFVDEIEGVLPEMAARVSFLKEELDPAKLAEESKLFVPGNAVAERDGKKVVFRVEDGKVRPIAVTLGEPLASGFELKAGPPEGTRVVADPPAELAEGQSIKEKSL